jgi:hypothetical protein
MTTMPHAMSGGDNAAVATAVIDYKAHARIALRKMNPHQ